ncbi:sulfatase-like hydrolase/transferase [Flavobacterium algicola]|uniref:sulfatase-like hydrolase/transferase n=1 Tax=Flavobacterium algicola TaxID=556529 RepID=UPI001EFD600F|nr:sulfatase-like hydrolase/transferase [Flavobacterium algicola]MCG9792298.1 sulfatase-like hydrolase/transferase [Flavobacterium algicola]
MNAFKIFLALIVVSSCQTKKIVNQENARDKVQKPNIVYILADDMGYGDVSALNAASGIQTPNMDKMLQNGVHFSDTHTNSSVCTPTRYGILTGRYAWRSRLKSGVLHGYDEALIEEDRPTVASFLKVNGYKTACIGKWHMGLGFQSKDNSPVKDENGLSNVDFTKTIGSPNLLGFDYSYIIPASLDMPPYVYIENGKAVEIPSTYTNGKKENVDGRGVFWRPGEAAPSFVFEKVLDNFTQKTVSYIGDQKKDDTPFFIYFPLTAPHTPWLPTGNANGKSKAGRYGDFVTMVDDAVGAVVEALEKAGKLENTLIIVTSDNGSNWKPEDKKAYAHRANYIFKGQKADIYEGGHRVPYIAQWKGVIPAGTQSNEIMCTTDLYATVAGVLHKPITKNEGPDSYNLWSAYTSNVKTPIREAIVHHSYDGMFSIRKGNWKFTPQLGSGGFTKPKTLEAKNGEAPGTLYDMAKDPQEENNLYKQHPEVVKELTQLLEKYKAQGQSRM